MIDPLLDDVALEITDAEKTLDDLRWAEPRDDIHAAKLAYQKAALERHIERLKEIA